MKAAIRNPKYFLSDTFFSAAEKSENLKGLVAYI
jgi:hypothetical protein